MEFAKQEYWSGLLFSTPGDIPDSGIELNSPALAGGFNHFVSKYFFFFFKRQRLRLQFYDCLNRMTEGGRWMEKIFI